MCLPLDRTGGFRLSGFRLLPSPTHAYCIYVLITFVSPSYDLRGWLGVNNNYLSIYLSLSLYVNILTGIQAETSVYPSSSLPERETLLSVKKQTMHRFLRYNYIHKSFQDVDLDWIITVCYRTYFVQQLEVYPNKKLKMKDLVLKTLLVLHCISYLFNFQEKRYQVNRLICELSCMSTALGCAYIVFKTKDFHQLTLTVDHDVPLIKKSSTSSLLLNTTILCWQKNILKLVQKRG